MHTHTHTHSHTYVYMYIYAHVNIYALCNTHTHTYSINKICREEPHGADYLLYVPLCAFSHLQNLQ